MRNQTGSLSAAARRLYQLLLLTVADEGADTATASFPGVSDARSGGNVNDLGELVDAGLVIYDTETGMVNAVLPLVATSTGTTVALDGVEQVTRRAASVVDAFAIAALLERPVRITEHCPVCDEKIEVRLEPQGIDRRQPGSVVAAGVPGDASTIRLTCSPQHAQALIDAGDGLVMLSIETLAIRAREQYAAVLP